MLDAFTIGVVISGVLIFFGITIAFMSYKVFTNAAISRRIADFVITDENPNDSQNEVVAIQEKMQGSLFNRMVVPRFKSFILFLGRFAPKRSISELNRGLSIAGNPYGMHALEFNGIKLVFFIFGLIIALLVIITTGMKIEYKYLLGVGVIFIAYFLPDVWLSSSIRKVKDQIRREFPDVLDMLSVCAYAGLGFDQALQRVSETLHSSLGGELRRTVQEIELGNTRAEALRNLSNRLEISEISSFVAVIVQAENLGMRIVDVLHAQAEQLRILKQFRAKEAANRLPAKMLFPLAIFILPALFAVIFAPVIPSLLTLLGNF